MHVYATESRLARYLNRFAFCACAFASTSRQMLVEFCRTAMFAPVWPAQKNSRSSEVILVHTFSQILRILRIGNVLPAFQFRVRVLSGAASVGTRPPLHHPRVPHLREHLLHRAASAT